MFDCRPQQTIFPWVLVLDRNLRSTSRRSRGFLFLLTAVLVGKNARFLAAEQKCALSRPVCIILKTPTSLIVTLYLMGRLGWALPKRPTLVSIGNWYGRSRPARQ